MWVPRWRRLAAPRCIRKAQGGQGTAEAGTDGARGAGGAIGRLRGITGEIHGKFQWEPSGERRKND